MKKPKRTIYVMDFAPDLDHRNLTITCELKDLPNISIEFILKGANIENVDIGDVVKLLRSLSVSTRIA